MYVSKKIASAASSWKNLGRKALPSCPPKVEQNDSPSQSSCTVAVCFGIPHHRSPTWSSSGLNYLVSYCWWVSLTSFSSWSSLSWACVQQLQQYQREWLPQAGESWAAFSSTGVGLLRFTACEILAPVTGLKWLCFLLALTGLWVDFMQDRFDSSCFSLTTCKILLHLLSLSMFCFEFCG